MLTRFKNWLIAHQQQRENKKFRDGYDYATGRLLKEGYAAVDVLENEVDATRVFGEYGPFDLGVIAALRRYHMNREQARLRAQKKVEELHPLIRHAKRNMNFMPLPEVIEWNRDIRPGGQ